MKITRARNYRLYFGDDKRRLLDLGLDGGRALFGHTPPGLGKSYKNAISRGLYASLETRIHGMVSRQLRELFPGYHSLIFPNRKAALDYLHWDEDDFAAADFRPPENLYKGLLIWRPFEGSLPAEPLPVSSQAYKRKEGDAEDAREEGKNHEFNPRAPLYLNPVSQSSNGGQPRIILPVFPQPGENSPQVLMYLHNAGLQPMDVPGCPGVALHGLQHCIGLTQRALHLGSFRSVAKQKYQPEKHRKAMGVSNFLFSEDQWRRFEPENLNPFRRVGPYIIPAGRGLEKQRAARDSYSRAVWRELSMDFRRKGLLLPDAPTDLLILPAIASEREADDIRHALQYIQRRMEESRGEQE